jgi:hypothetical protein
MPVAADFVALVIPTSFVLATFGETMKKYDPPNPF